LPAKPHFTENLKLLKGEKMMLKIIKLGNVSEIRKHAWLMFMRNEKYFKMKK